MSERPADAAALDSSGGPEIERILDVMVELTVELGRRRVAIGEVLSLKPGAVVEFMKTADEPLDIRVNGRLVARGEAVVIGDRYGVRVTQVVSPGERLDYSGIGGRGASGL